jgi:RNA polymerase sigma-70 factor (ECF subfamily)
MMAGSAWPMAGTTNEAGAQAPSVPWPEVVATIRGQMRSIVGPTQDLEDLTQAALERMVRGADRFQGRAALSTYTYRVCARIALNHWRWWRRWARRFQIGAVDELEPLGDARDPGAELHERARARRLHALLERMDPLRRLVLTLSDLEDLPASRIAEILDCGEPTVRSRLRLAREDLVALLARDPFFRDERRVEPS